MSGVFSGVWIIMHVGVGCTWEPCYLQHVHNVMVHALLADFAKPAKVLQLQSQPHIHVKDWQASPQTLPCWAGFVGVLLVFTLPSELPLCSLWTE